MKSGTAYFRTKKDLSKWLSNSARIIKDDGNGFKIWQVAVNPRTPKDYWEFNAAERKNKLGQIDFADVPASEKTDDGKPKHGFAGHDDSSSFDNADSSDKK